MPSLEYVVSGTFKDGDEDFLRNPALLLYNDHISYKQSLRNMISDGRGVGDINLFTHAVYMKFFHHYGTVLSEEEEEIKRLFLRLFMWSQTHQGLQPADAVVAVGHTMFKLGFRITSLFQIHHAASAACA